MNNTEALVILENTLTAVLRFRSMAKEELPKELMSFAGDNEMKWSLGEDSIIIPLHKVLDKDPPYISGADFYNLMFICTHLGPEIAYATQFLTGIELPEPDTSWLTDPEWKCSS